VLPLFNDNKEAVHILSSLSLQWSAPVNGMNVF
jgi:hypothetical protein